MRSLKDLGEFKVCDLSLRKGYWYEVKCDEYSSDVWIFKLYGIVNDKLLQEGLSYVITNGVLRDSYDCGDEGFYPLCFVSNVVTIKRVSLRYIRGFGIVC
jgi:hypothetical protein